MFWDNKFVASKGFGMKLFMKIGLLSCVLFISHNLAAQEEAQKNNALESYYGTELFQWSYNFWNGFNLNYQNQSAATSFRLKDSMQKALSSYDDTNKKLLTYKKQTLFGHIFLWSGLTAFVASPAVLISDVYRDIGPERTMYAFYGTLGGGLLSALIGSVLLDLGRENIFDAVNIYNRNKIAEYNY